MPKKKKAKKKATRKSAPKKKSAAKRTTRKTAAKSKPKPRKPSRKAKAPARKKPVARAASVATTPAPKVFTVNPGNCTISPDKHNVEAQSDGGSVQFNATAGCDIEFSDTTVLGLPSPYTLVQGSNGPYPVLVDNGNTEFWISNCSGDRDTSDPSDIIVP